MGLRGGRPGCLPRLFEAGQAGNVTKPPRLMLINRGEHSKKTVSVNAY
jgi:hypothetical protein